MTRLLYLEDTRLWSACSVVLAIELNDGVDGVVVEATPAYPRGGGQPADTGTITGPAGSFAFDNVVRRTDGTVLHVGRIVAGDLEPGQPVSVEIDGRRRAINARVHTAGELICAAVHRLGHYWEVTAASHVPGQARVAFASTLATDGMEPFCDRLLVVLQDLVAVDHPVETAIVTDTATLGDYCPQETHKAFANWPVRVVSVAPGFWRPCLGAHCAATGEVGSVRLGRVRLKGKELSVSYGVDN